MTQKVYNVLFLCTGNSARSIMAERLLAHWGRGRFRAYSAGSFPTGRVHPCAIATLQAHGLDTAGLRSKRWDEFAVPGAPPLDFVFTVCDNAAGEACPVWPGQPVTAHWGVPDPVAVAGEAQPEAFRRVCGYLEKRIKLFAALPLEKLDALSLTQALRDIGHT